MTEEYANHSINKKQQPQKTCLLLIYAFSIAASAYCAYCFFCRITQVAMFSVRDEIKSDIVSQLTHALIKRLGVLVHINRYVIAAMEQMIGNLGHFSCASKVSVL